MDSNFDNLIKFYEKNIDDHNDGYKALGWGSIDSQYKRFEVLSKINNLNGSSILDVGCGLGDFYLWFKYKWFINI